MEHNAAKFNVFSFHVCSGLNLPFSTSTVRANPRSNSAIMYRRCSALDRMPFW